MEKNALRMNGEEEDLKEKFTRKPFDMTYACKLYLNIWSANGPSCLSFIK